MGAFVAAIVRGPDRAGQNTGRMQAQQTQASEETQKQAANADDMAINAKVKAAIMADPTLKGISVDTKNATVTLSGRRRLRHAARSR